MQNIKPFFMIIAILAMMFVGCQNEQIGSESADTTPTSVPSGNSGDKITSLQAVIDEDETGVIDLSQYSDYTITSYSATINKSITIKGANKDFDKAEITVNKDNVSLSGMKNVKSVTASASLGNGSMRISSSSLSDLNIYGGGSHSIYIEDNSEIDILTVDKIITPQSNEFVRLVIDDTVKIGTIIVKRGLLIDTIDDVSVDIKNVEFDVSDVPAFIAISPKVTLDVTGDVSADQTVKVTFKNDTVSSNALSTYMPKGTKVEDLSADFIISAFEMIVAEPLNQTFKAALTQGFTAMMTEIFDGDTIDETKDIKITVSEGNQIKGEEVNTTPTEETAQYKVKYLFQKVSGDEYESLDEYPDQTKSSTINTMTDVTADSVTGFDLQTIAQQNIAANGSTIVEVRYDRKTITYTFNAAGGKWVDVDTTTDTGCFGAEVAVPANPARTGYTFSKWDKTIPETFGADNETFTAEWNINHYTVTFKDGETELSTQDVTYDCTATAPTNPTKDSTATVIYSFAYWYVEAAPNEAYSFDSPVTGVLTLYAKWNETQLYSITINQGEHGTVTASQTSGIEAGTEITLTITPDNGYVLDSLTVTYDSENVSVTDNKFTMPAGNVTVSASFVIGIAYRSASWDESQSMVVYTDLAKKAGEYTSVTNSTSSWSDGGWYVVEQDVAITNRITVSGTANLILCDGATLTTSGITVIGNNKINIYAQSQGTGKLIAASNTDNNTGIGSIGDGQNIGGTVTIFGGIVEATGGNGAAGIGARYNNNNSDTGYSITVTIFGGDIKAIGGTFSAGIGGCYASFGGDVTIYGGKVYAKGGGTNATGTASGIGGGHGNQVGYYGGKCAIYGGDVTAYTGDDYMGHSIGAGIEDVDEGGTNQGDGDLIIQEDMTVYTGTSEAGASKRSIDFYDALRYAYVHIYKE